MKQSFQVLYSLLSTQNCSIPCRSRHFRHTLSSYSITKTVTSDISEKANKISCLFLNNNTIKLMEHLSKSERRVTKHELLIHLRSIHLYALHLVTLAPAWDALQKINALNRKRRRKPLILLSETTRRCDNTNCTSSS